jgi:hypothetical protein
MGYNTNDKAYTYRELSWGVAMEAKAIKGQ